MLGNEYVRQNIIIETSSTISSQQKIRYQHPTWSRRDKVYRILSDVNLCGLS